MENWLLIIEYFEFSMLGHCSKQLIIYGTNVSDLRTIIVVDLI